MSRNFLTKPTRTIAGLLTGLLFAILAIPLAATTAPESRGRGFGPAYDAAHETTLNGTIQEVVTKRVAGSPVGMHLLVAGPEGVVDAHVGPYLTKDTQEALHAGLPVQIVGAVEQLQGKSILLARQLIFGGRTVTVRSENGFLMRAHASRSAHSRSDHKNATTTQKGESL
jgi:xanthosine utilization system XapX-like protein